MKKWLFILPIIILLVSCEKHDGELYFKARCDVEYKGKTYIDQTRFETILSPNSQRSPSISEFQYKKFSGFKIEVKAAPARDKASSIFISLYINGVDYKSDDLTGRSFTISLDETFAGTATDSHSYSKYEYTEYCYENGINYGSIINWEEGVEYIVDYGTLTFSGKDHKTGSYNGTFSCTTANGEYVGRFYNL